MASAWDNLRKKKEKEEKTQEAKKPAQSYTAWDNLAARKEKERQKELESLKAKQQQLSTYSGAHKAAQEADYYREATAHDAKWYDKASYDKNYAAYQNALNAANSAYRAEDTLRQSRNYMHDMLRGANPFRALTPVRSAEQDLARQAGRLSSDAAFYQQMAKDAAAMGSQEMLDQAQRGLERSGGRYDAAYNAYSEKANQARQRNLDELKANNKSQWYAETLSREQIEGQLRQLEQRKAENSRAADLATEAAKNDPNRAAVYSSQAGDDREPWYMKALWNTDRKNDEIDAEIARYQAALRQKDYDDYAILRAQMAPNGKLANAALEAKWNQGKQKYEADKATATKAANQALAAKASADYHAGRATGGMTREQLRQAQEEAGYFHEFEEALHLDEADRDIFYALYADDPDKAKKFLHQAKLAGDQRYMEEIGKEAQGGPLERAAALIGGTALNIAGGVYNLIDPYSEKALDLNRTGQAYISGGAQDLQEKGIFNTGLLAGKVEDGDLLSYLSLGVLDDKGLGDLYSLGSSMLESGVFALAAAATGNYSAALGKVIGFLGTTIMGSSAAASDYEDGIKRGLTRQQAITHATAAGIAEAAFEYISLDHLVELNPTAGFWKTFFTQGGVEASEELCTTLANRISDGLLARAQGYDTQIEQRMKELIAMGMSTNEAKQSAEREWIIGLINDGLGGLISGGVMSTAKYVAYPWQKIQQVRQTNRYNERTGALSSRTGEAAALAQYAADNNLGWTAPEQSAEAVNQSESGTGETENADSSAAPQNDKTGGAETQNDVSKSTLGQKVTKAAEEKKTRKELRQERRTNRQTGEDVNRARSHIQEQLAGKTVQEQQAIRDELVKKYGAGMELPVYRAVSMETAKQAMELESTDAIRQAREAVLAEIQDEDMKRAVAEGYDQAAYQKAAQSNDLNAAAKYLQQVRNTGSGGMSMTATVTGEDGQSRQVRIADMTEDGKGVKLEDGTVVAAKDLVADADTMDVVKQLARLNLGRDASAVLQAYRDSGVAESEGYRWIMDYATAYEQGRTARISLQQAAERSSLDAKTVMDAYTKGRQYAQAETEKAEERKNKARKKGVTGRKSNIDTSELTRKGITYEKMTKAERQQYDLANKIFELIGVDLKWIASDIKTDSKGREYYSGVNGSYLNGVVTLDIHAGQNYVEALRSGVLATTGHELTHFLEQYAPKQYKALKEFVFQQIVENSANGEQTLERMIWEKQKRSKFRISAREAEHEVVADACQEMLLDSEAIREFAAENEEAAKGMVRWLRDFFAKIKAAFKQSTELTEQARFMAGLEKDVRKAFGKLWDEALREAVKAHDEIGNIEKPQQQQNSDRDTEYLEAVENDDMETAQKMVRAAAKKAGYNSPKLYHGSSAFGFTSFNMEKSFGQIFATTSIKTAKTYSGETKLMRLSDQVKLDVDALHGDALLEAANKYLDNRYDKFKLLTDTEKKAGLQKAQNNITKLAQKAAEFRQKRADRFDAELSGIYEKMTDALNRIASAQTEDDYEAAYKQYDDALWDFKWKDGNLFSQYIWDVPSKDVLNAYRDGSDFLYQVDLYRYTDTDGKWAAYLGNGLVFDNQMALELDAELHKGVYQLYGRMGKKLTIDANGANWNAIVTPEELHLDRPSKTRTIAEKAFALGYDSVEIKNVRDNSDGTDWRGISDVYIFNAKNAVKSADPVTYDDSGNVIPLSERFNTENQDIRYSDREDQGLRDRVRDLEEQLEFAEVNDLTQAEIRKLNNELIKARGQLDSYTANQRRQAKRTSFNEILQNLKNYERVDLESLAEQISDSAWDGYEELSDEELIDALRETINERLEDFTPGEADNPKYGLFVKKPVREAAKNITMLREQGIEIDADSGAAVQYSIRTAPQTEEEINEAVQRLLDSGLGFTETESKSWLKSLTTVSSMVLQNMMALDYVNDERYHWLKKNSDYTQGSIDFNTNCPKRTQFTAIFDRLQREFPDRVFTAQDYEAIRQKLIEHGVTVTCGPCFVEDRRQHTGEIAQGFIDQLKSGELKPKFRNMIGSDSYVPTQYDLVTYEGLRKLFDTHRGIHNAFVAFNNARGMAAARLVEGMAEYNNQIKKWSKRTVTGKNNKGGLRIFSLSDADPRTMLDIIQITIDAAEKGLMIQGYTKKPWFARMVKDTGMRILRSHIPKGNGIRNGAIWYDDTEGINRFDKNYKDDDGNDIAEVSKNIGDNIIGINDEMIRLAMKTREIDQIIPFHSSLANMIRNKKKIGDWKNYKNSQTDKVKATGKVADKQVNIYKDVINAWAAKGTPITNKVEFVNAFLEVCEQRGLTPRFDEFLDKVDGKYVYTEGYEKFLVDYKLFDRNTGEIIPQEAVKATFDDGYNKRVLEDYVKGVSEIVPADEETFEDVRNMFAEGAQYSERDYDQISDLDLMDQAAESLSEAGGEEYWNALLESAPELADDKAEIQSMAKAYREQAKKLAEAEAALEEAKRQMTPGGNRKLNTRGISGLALDIMKSIHAGDVHNKQVAKNVAQILAQAYQKALNAIDAGKEPGAVWDIVYSEGVEKAADFMLENATYSEKFSYKWVVSKLGDYLKGEDGRWSVIDAISAKVIMDWSQNRMRQRMEATKADKLIERTENRMQKQIDEAKARAKTAENRNAELEENVKFLKQKQEENAGTIEHLGERLEEARKELKESKGKSAKEQKAALDKAKRLNERLQAKKQEAAAWKTLASRNEALLNAALKSKNADIDALRIQMDRNATEAQKKQAALVQKLADQVQREKDILSGKLKPLAMQRLLKAERERAAREAEAHKDEVFQNYKERKNQTAIRNRIKNLHAEMERDLLRPREGHFVPEALVRPVVELLDMVNTQTNRAKSESAQAKIDAINAAYDKIKNDERYSMYYDETVKALLVELSGTLAGRSIYELNSDELADVYTAMKAMRTTIRNAIRADLIEKGKEIFEVGNELRQELRNGKGAHAYLLEKYHMSMLNAQRAFNRFGGYRQDSTWNKVYRMLDNAQLDMLRIEMEATRIFDPVLKAKADFEKAQDLTSIKEKDLVDVGLKDADGNAVKITRGMMLALYMHLQNEENMRHIMYGGMTLPDFKRYYNGNPEAWGRGTVEIPALGARVSNLDQLLEEQGEQYVDDLYKEYEDEIREMFESVRAAIEERLTDYDRKWIASSKDFFDNFSRRELNRVTNSMYGFSKAKVDNYFPIVTDSNFLKSEFDSISRNVSLENAGFMKERVKASNPILLEDITRTVNRQISNVSRYAGLTEALKQFGNVYNVQTKGFTDSVKKAMAKSYGKTGQEYIQNLITDMVGGRSTPGTIFDRIKGNYAQAVLSANLSVTIKQAASYPTAAAVVGWKPLMKALAKGGKNGRLISRADRALIDAYSPLLWKRSQGAIDTEIGDMAHAQDWTKKAKWLMGWIEKTDIATVGRLWYAAEYYVQDNFKGLEKGDAEQIRNGESPYYKKVAEVFNRIVEETQPNYTVLQRPDILRNPNKLVRSLVMFSTQRFQNGQILMDAAAEYGAMRSLDRKGSTEETTAARQEAKRKLTWAITSQAVSAVVLNAMTLLAGALMHRMNPWRDDDDEITMESTAGALLDGWVESLAGSFLGGSEIYEALDSLLTGSTYYGNDVGGLSSINDFASALITMGQKAMKLVGDDNSKPEDWANLAKNQLWKVGEYLSQMTGVPVANVRKIIEGGVQHVQDAMETHLFSYEAGLARSNTANARRYAEAWQAGDGVKMQAVVDEMNRNLEKAGKSTDGARDAITKAAKERYEAGEIELDQYADFLRQAGYLEEDKIESKIRDFLRDELVSGDRTEDEVLRLLTELGGLTEDKAWKKVMEWKAKAETGDGDDEAAKYSEYDALREALRSGTSFQEAAADYLAHGYTEKQITDAAVDHLKDRYLAGEISEAEAVKTWSEYKGKDENEAWMAVQRWEGTAAHDGDEDYSFSQYDAIDEAIDANKDIKALVKELTDHGVEEKNISSHVKSYLVDRYVAGGVTETALKNQLSRYLGIVAKDDVDKILNDANSKKQYGGLSSADADKKIRWYDLQKANPSLEISESKANTWYDGTSYTKTNGHESAKAAGLSIQDYLRAKDELAKVKGVDANNDGRTDAGSREIAYIRALTAMSWLTDRQRRALYYEEYKGTSKTSGRPW